VESIDGIATGAFTWGTCVAGDANAVWNFTVVYKTIETELTSTEAQTMIANHLTTYHSHLSNSVVIANVSSVADTPNPTPTISSAGTAAPAFLLACLVALASAVFA